jgi:DNA polymerase
MFVGEAPGATENATGRPFVGRSGELLDRVLNRVGILRENTYITNVLKCRPPQNRDPLVEEKGKCVPFLHAQIKLIQPKVLVALGKQALQALSGREDYSIKAAVRKQGEFYDNRQTGVLVPIVACFHPSYVLRRAQEGKRWSLMSFIECLEKVKEWSINPPDPPRNSEFGDLFAGFLP